MNRNGGTQCIKINQQKCALFQLSESAHYSGNVIILIRNMMLPKNSVLCIIQAANNANMQSCN